MVIYNFSMEILNKIESVIFLILEEKMVLDQ